ncbi:uncharacterized protein TNCV_3142541 [Trichonephila clavipes]|nr:uncharacterized protein TNCV_3142541 [Trichonephila clavipes]
MILLGQSQKRNGSLTEGEALGQGPVGPCPRTSLQISDANFYPILKENTLKGGQGPPPTSREELWLVRRIFRVSHATKLQAAVAEWYRYRTVACFVKGSSPVPLKTRRVGQRCTLNLSRAETSSRWCGVVVRRGGCQLRCRPRHLTMVQNYVVRRQKPSCS